MFTLPFPHKLWEEIPSTLKQLPFRKTFSKQLKNSFLEKLPTNKRTKEIKFEKKALNKSLDLIDIFSQTGNDESFFGFE